MRRLLTSAFASALASSRACAWAWASARARCLVAGLLLLSLLASTSGCRGAPATEAECRAILDRIVELELGELGFRDPVLAERKKAQLGRQLADELGKCVGLPLPAGALACVRRARSTEEISHGCLR